MTKSNYLQIRPFWSQIRRFFSLKENMNEQQNSPCALCPLILLLVLGVATLNAQEVTLEIKKADYYHPNDVYKFLNSKGWIDIADEKALPIQPFELYLKRFSHQGHTEAWNKSGVTKPVAYVSGNYPRIKATFKYKSSGIIGCNAPRPEIWIRAKWVINGSPDNAPIIIKPVKIIGIGSEVTIGPIPFDYLFLKDEVRYVATFQLFWEFANAENALVWKDAGVSTHPLYITHREPTATLAGGLAPATFLYSTLHVGCENANGYSDIKAIVDRSYSAFEDQNVERVNDSGGMLYWGDWSESTNHSWHEWPFLYNKDGRCGNWGPFLGSIMSLHGVNEEPYIYPGATTEYNSHSTTATAYDYHGGQGYLPASAEITMFDKIEEYFGDEFDRANPFAPISSTMRILIQLNEGKTNTVGVFFVKNWDFSEGENKLYLLEPTSSSMVSPTGFTIIGAEELGLSGQGPILNPRSHFDNHCVMSYDKFIYDPSYGSNLVEIFSNNEAPQWVTNNVAGVGAFIRYFPSSGVAKELIWLHKNSNLNTYIKFN